MNRAAWGLLVMMSSAAAAGAFAAQPGTSPPATAHVTYVAASSAYVDAGHDEGLREGDELEVVRDGQVVATLKVTFVSTHSASCSVANATSTLAVGDSVRYMPSAPAAVVTPPSAESRSGVSRGSGVHGRVGLSYLSVIDQSGNNGGYQEPSLDLRLAGYGLNGSPVDVDVDVRARRTADTTFAGGSETTSRARTYACSLSYRFGEHERLSFGRLRAPMLDGIEIFDGLLFDSDGPRWGGGVLAGYLPDFADLSFSKDIHEYAGYFRVHNRPGATARWEFTTGLAGSYAQSTVNREYLFLQGIFIAKRFSMFATENVDFNRGWKVDVAGLDAVQPTATFVSFRVHAAKWLDLNAGYDDRKKVFLYRDFVTPLTVFDDTHRTGAWTGASLRFGRHVDVGLEGRQSRGGLPGTASSYSLNVGAERFTRADFGVRLRGTHFTNDQSSGDLYALSTGATVAPGLHLEVSGGRLEESNIDPSLDRHSTWYGLDMDAAIGRRWYILISLERNQGNFETQDQVYASVAFRF